MPVSISPAAIVVSKAGLEIFVVYNAVDKLERYFSGTYIKAVLRPGAMVFDKLARQTTCSGANAAIGGKTFAENVVQVHKRITRKLKRYKVFVLQFLARLPMTLIDAVLLNTYSEFQPLMGE